MSSSKQIITGLDVGTEKVCAVMGQKTDDGIDMIGIGTSKGNGLRKGMVIDIEETISSISRALEDAEKMAGTTSDTVYVGIGGAHIQSSNSKGVIPVSRADGEITQEDVNKVIEAAKAVSVPANREIIHVIPRLYTVDGQEGIHDPVGMTGTRLELEANVISGSTPVIKNLSKSIFQSGLSIAELVLNPLAAAEFLLTKRQKEVGSALIDIGAGTTELAVFEEGDIMHSSILPVGSNSITNDIAIGLKISIDAAEQIKREFGFAKADSFSEEDEIDLSKIDKSEQTTASKSYIAQIIEARLSEIFSLINKELASIDREANLPAGVHFCGGGAKLNGLIDAAKEELRLPAQLGEPAVEVSGLIEKVSDPSYATAIGLLIWGLNAEPQEISKSKFDFSDTSDKIKGVFKKFFS